MKNYIFGIFFTFLYIVAMVRPLLPLIEYYANYDYIAKELCINKDKPYMECNGRCYINAALKRIGTSGDQTQNKVIVFKLSDYPFSTLDFFSIDLKTNNDLHIENTPSTYVTHALLNAFAIKIFRPPIG